MTFSHIPPLRTRLRLSTYNELFHIQWKLIYEEV
jgi:hypothetical protein